MSKTVVIGSSFGKPIGFELDSLLTTRLLVQANSGAGKSWLLRRLAEQLFPHVQVVIIDPEGEFATLREQFAFVLVGKGGEVAADPRIAGDVALKLLELRASAVCDLYELKAPERSKWVKEFLEAIVNAPKALWHPLVVIIDEAHIFCPEKGSGDSEAASSVIDLITRGRKRGFCTVLATQRLAKVDKNATSELLNRLIGGTFEDVDMKRALELLSVPNDTKEGRVFKEQLRTIDPGWFYAFGRAIAKERTLLQVGPIATTHPKPGSSKHAAAPPPPPEKLRELLSKLADLPKEAEERARTVADLKKRVAELERELKAKPAAVAPAAEPIVQEKLVEVPFVRDRELELLSEFVGRIEAVRSGLGDELRIAAGYLESVKQSQESFRREFAQRGTVADNRAKKITPRESIHTPVKKLAPVSATRPKSNGHAPSSDLPEGEKKILIACAQYPDGVDKTQLSVLTGYKRSTRDRYLQYLRQKELVMENGGNVFATQGGIDALGDDYEELPTGEELQQYWLNKLPDGERKILQVLIDVNGNAIARDELDEPTGFKRSTRDRYLQYLSARKLVEQVGKGEVRASQELFA